MTNNIINDFRLKSLIPTVENCTEQVPNKIKIKKVLEIMNKKLMELKPISFNGVNIDLEENYDILTISTVVGMYNDAGWIASYSSGRFIKVVPNSENPSNINEDKHENN